MEKKIEVSSTSRFSLGFIFWLGGAIHVAHQDGFGFWDGVFWMYYVGRYIAHNFALLH